jgi:hypothetical protein
VGVRVIDGRFDKRQRPILERVIVHAELRSRPSRGRDMPRQVEERGDVPRVRTPLRVDADGGESSSLGRAPTSCRLGTPGDPRSIARASLLDGKGQNGAQTRKLGRTASTIGARTFPAPIWNTVGTHRWSAVDSVDFHGLAVSARPPHLQGNREIRKVDALNS